MKTFSRFILTAAALLLIYTTVDTAAASLPAASGPAQGLQGSGPQSIAELDASPQEADAVVADAQVPAWMTRYGTQAGVELLPPRKPVVEASPQGPQVPLGGWISHSLNAGSNSITAIVRLPAGRVAVGLSAGGLRIYVPDESGEYHWNEIHSGDPGGGPASDNITALGVLGLELWVGTSDSGLSILNLETGAWSYVTYPTIPGNYIHRITVITSVAQPDYVWVATFSGATRYAFRISPEPGYYWSTYTQGNSGLPDDIVYDIAVQPVGESYLTWFGTEGGVATLQGATWTDVYAAPPCAGLAASQRILVDRENSVWLSAWAIAVPLEEGDSEEPQEPQLTQPFGVCRYKNGIWSLFSSDNGLPSDLVSDMSQDYAGRIWMSFDNFYAQTGGGAVYDQDTWLIFERPGAPFYSDRLHRVYAVGEAVWYGHLLASELRVYSAYWTRYSAAQMGGSDRPRAVLVEGLETTLGLGAGFTTIDGTFAWHYTAIPGNTANVVALARGGDGRLWIGTRGGGLYAFDGLNFEHHNTAGGLPGDDIRELAVDHQGRPWVATNAGIAMRASGYWLALTAATSPLPEDDLLALAVDGQDRLWIGTNGSGIAIFDPNNKGGAAAWSSQDTGDGLPSNTVYALAISPSGMVWAGTDAGLGAWDPGTGTWVVYNAANGDLPGDMVISLATDSIGRVWAGTDKGLALRESNAWMYYQVPGTALGSDRILALGADDERVWAAAGSYAAARGFVNDPIGFYIPVITAFNPSEGAPFTQVTISGNHFDNRGPAFNKVYFYGSPWQVEGEVLSASQTQLVVRVPLLAESGKVRVEAHNLIGESPTDFIVRPAIQSLNPLCLGMGDELQINASGLGGYAAAEVKVGNGAWRLADATDPTMVRTFIRPGDTAGQVRLRYTNNGYTSEVVSSQSVSISTPQVEDVSAQQAIEGLPMIWEKNTLVQLSLKSSGGCSSHISSGKAYWKQLSGDTYLADYVSFDSPGLLTVTTWGSGVDANAVVKPGLDGLFPQSQLESLRIVLRNGPVDVITYEIPASTFGFVTPQYRRNFLNYFVLEPGNTDAEYLKFRSDVSRSMEDVQRIYPQHMSYQGNQWWANYFALRTWQYGLVDLDAGTVGDVISHFSLLKGWAEDARDFANDNGGHWSQAQAVVQGSLYTSGTPSGKATIGYPSSVTFHFEDSMAPTYLQEGVHAITWVQSGSPNHDGGNEYHSRYDEGEWNSGDPGSCNSSLTFRQALVDQIGFAASTVRIGGFYSPETYQFPLIGCRNRTNMPGSAMSYANGQSDEDTFLEPLDYLYTYCRVAIAPPIPSLACLQYTKDYFSLLDSGEQLSPQEYAARMGFSIDFEEPARSLITASQDLRLNGTITQEDEVVISLAYLQSPGGETTPEAVAGNYHLRFRSAGGDLLDDFTFEISFETTHGEPSPDARFSLRVPVPDGTSQVQILHLEDVIWEQGISPNPPVVSFVSPSGGVYDSTGTIPVQWAASDPDGGVLFFNLSYSPDDGATWYPLHTGLTGNTFDWTPYAIPAGSAVRLRLQASDSFNTASADSAPFTLNPYPPGAILLSPADGDTFTEGETITLNGGSITSAGDNLGDFDWLQDGALIGFGITSTVQLNFVGTSTFELQVHADGMTASDTATIEVLPDYDRDGMPNAWELAYEFNPFDPSNVDEDPDGDTLSNLFEYQIGTNPLLADSDGDGFDDGWEVGEGTDPNDPTTLPLAFIFLPVVNR